MDEYVVEGTTGHRDDDDKTQVQRLYCSTIDSVLGEMDPRFRERNSLLASALVALNPESDTFLDVKAVKHVLDLSQWPVIESTKLLNSSSDRKNHHRPSRRIGLYNTSSQSDCFQTRLNIWRLHSNVREFILHSEKRIFGPQTRNATQKKGPVGSVIF